MSQEAVNNSIQAWVEIINSSTPTKGSVMHDETSKLSDKAADTLFGQPTTTNDFESDLYELRKLADEVLESVAAKSAQGLAFRVAGETLPYDRPGLEFTLPLPSWDEA